MTASKKLWNKIQNVLNTPGKRRLGAIALCALLGLAVFVFATQPAYAVRVSLKRIVFEGNKRSEILTLINNSNEPQTFRLGWRKYRMSDGESPLRAIEDGAASDDILWADSMVRYAPRRVTIPPGGSQQVRLLLRRPADIQEAEYRAHLWIVTESQPEAFSATPGSRNQSVRLAVQPAISLPIFVRHGKLNAETIISDAKLSKTSDNLAVAFKLTRNGSRSVYGDFDFVCEDTIVHQVRGIAVYTETNYRDLDFKIPLTSVAAQTCSSMKIVYRSDPNDSDFAGATLAEAVASLQ